MENYVNAAVEQFRSILEEQIARQRKMEKDTAYTDYKKLDKIKVLSVAPAFAEAIKRIDGDISLSEMFN